MPCTEVELRLSEDFSELPFPQGRLVAGFDVGRTRDRSELALFEVLEHRFVCRLLRRYDQTPFAEQEGDLRRMLQTLPIARLSIDKSGIGMNLAENLCRDFPQVVGEVFSSESKERWATDLKILLQRRDIALPRDRDLVAQVHSIKRRVLPSGKVSFDAERSGRGGHADRFWAIALACQKERQAGPARVVEIGVRVIG
ncbi:MAG: terminase [Deltaproteobacteria bacterium RIFOXYA12_FULL_61_11]|nr:MAG: terminase [Deltaproteobacteria bacterium RIFOXYA12_FULL_61_11]